MGERLIRAQKRKDGLKEKESKLDTCFKILSKYFFYIFGGFCINYVSVFLCQILII